MNQRVGIFSGSFDPVHKGHITFALQALQEAKLDKVYFLPEVKPRRKIAVTHISHRLTMLEQALKPYSGLEVLEISGSSFSVSGSLPRLQNKFKDQELFLLLGSDVIKYLHTWPLAERLISLMGLVVGLRGMNEDEAQTIISRLPTKPKALYVINNKQPLVSSTAIRLAAERGQRAPGSLDSISDYIKDKWLYQTIRE